MNIESSKRAGRFAGAGRSAPLLAVAAAAPLTLGSCCNDCGPAVPPYNVPESVAVADMNGDGRQDLAIAGYLHNEAGPDETWVAVFSQQAAVPGTFAIASNVVVAGNLNFPRLALTDVDGVNGPDVIVAPIASTSVAILTQSAGGVLQTSTTIDLGTLLQDLAVGDVNGDGAVDIVLADGRRPTGGVKVLLHNAAAPGTFLAPTTIVFDRVVAAVSIGDIDGDGRTDLAAAAYSNFQGSNGAGTVSILYADPNNPGAFLPRVDFPAGAEPSSIRLADVDRDGRMDVVVTNARTYQGVGNAGVSVLLQNPNAPGALLAPTHHDVPGVVAAVAIADLNGDAWSDLAVAAGSASDALTIFLQDPTRPGAFFPPVKYAGGSIAAGIAVGQLNNDALPDIAVARYQGVEVFFNSAAAPGTFVAPTQLNR